MRFTPKLTDHAARRIREETARGVPDRDLALEYEVSVSLIRSIRTGKSHKNAGGPICTRPRTTHTLKLRVTKLERHVGRLEAEVTALRDAVDRKVA